MQYSRPGIRQNIDGRGTGKPVILAKTVQQLLYARRQFVAPGQQRRRNQNRCGQRNHSKDVRAGALPRHVRVPIGKGMTRVAALSRLNIDFLFNHTMTAAIGIKI